MARLSVLVANAIKETKKENGDTKEAIEALVAKISTAVEAYAGKDSAEAAFERNAGVKTQTVEGTVPMSILDEASLLAVIQKEQKKIAVAVTGDDKDDNYSQNAELARAIATNSQILGAVACLKAGDAGDNEFL